MKPNQMRLYKYVQIICIKNSYLKLYFFYKYFLYSYLEIYNCTGWNDKIVAAEKNDMIPFPFNETGFLFCCRTIY